MLLYKEEIRLNIGVYGKNSRCSIGIYDSICTV